jgi:hypothetical protein
MPAGPKVLSRSTALCSMSFCTIECFHESAL